MGAVGLAVVVGESVSSVGEEDGRLEVDGIGLIVGAVGAWLVVGLEVDGAGETVGAVGSSEIDGIGLIVGAVGL